MCLFNANTILFWVLQLCNILWNQEVWNLDLFFLKIALASWDHLWFHTNFRIVLFLFCEKCPLNFDRDCINSVDCFQQHEHFSNILIHLIHEHRIIFNIFYKIWLLAINSFSLWFSRKLVIPHSILNDNLARYCCWFFFFLSELGIYHSTSFWPAKVFAETSVWRGFAYMYTLFFSCCF